MTEFGVKYFLESTGVGANAFKDHEVFFANSPLSELVWSQAEGLGIKYTNSCGIRAEKTPIYWNTDSFNIIVNTPFNGVCFLSKEEREMEKFRSLSDLGPRNLVTRCERDTKSCGEVNLMNEPNQELDEKIVSNINFENKRTDESDKKSDVNKGPINDDVSMSVFRASGSNQDKSLKIPKSSSSSSKRERITKTNRNFLDKGKEKVIYERENENMLKESDNESVESTGSIMSKRKRPFKFCNSNMLENKRFKKEIANKSSFMNWISSIASGFKTSNETPMIKPLNVEKWTSSSSQKSNEGNNIKTITPFVPNGFGSFFHNLYRQNNILSSCSNKKESFSLEKSSPREANFNTKYDSFNFGRNSVDRSQDEIKTENPNRLSIEIGNKIEKGEESGWACVVRKTGSSNSSNNDNKSRSNVNSSNNDDSKSRSNEEKGNMNSKGGYLENIWISRLLPKDTSSSKPRFENSEMNEGQSERKFKSNLNPIIPSNKRKETDCMASLFARRLGAIKHAEPSNLCSFQNLGKIEEEKMCSFKNLERNKEELEGSQRKSSSNDKKIVLWCEKKGKNVANELCGERNSEWKEISSSNENINKKGKAVIRNNDDNLLKCNNLVDETSSVFESVQRLRFSRMDIIRWMKSSIKNATLDGFYLRLRLSKLKQQIGKTGYHVGRINGISGDKFLSVRVGRFTCLVEPHCVSNQDFLEDELKAWWSSAERGDFGLPLKEELDRKLKEKHHLGF